TCSHVLLDSFLYPEMNPLFPILGNPFLGMVSHYSLYVYCTYLGLAGLTPLVALALMDSRSHRENDQPE
ncbi:MAG: hypothetical protein QXQ81_01655, partial [Candidatus Thorarchaeota archaeon]